MTRRDELKKGPQGPPLGGPDKSHSLALSLICLETLLSAPPRMGLSLEANSH